MTSKQVRTTVDSVLELTEREQKLVAAYLRQKAHQKAYMTAYNSKPGVAEHRKEYAKNRRTELKAALAKARELKLA